MKTMAALALSATVGGGAYSFSGSGPLTFEPFPRCLSKHELRAGKWREGGENVSEKCGEDSFMIGRRRNTFAVADGVGGWVKHGVNPKHFSEQLVRELQELVDQCQTETISDHVAVVDSAYTTVKKKVKSGSSTLCLATANRAGSLTTYNIGDSGLIIVRNGAVAFQTTETSHSFNFPKQLGVHRGKQAGDNASDGVVETFALQRGDALLLMSDGVTDNVSPVALAKIVASHSTCGDEVAKSILRQTATSALEGNKGERPWDKGGYGQKPDDISVLLVCVK